MSIMMVLIIIIRRMCDVRWIYTSPHQYIDSLIYHY